MLIKPSFSLIKRTIFYVFLPAVLFSGCALIVHGSRQKMVLTCEPKVASVFINGMSRGQTPMDIRLERRKTHNIRIELDGYQPYEVTIKKKLSPWIFGNLIFGGLIGIAIDLATGSVYKLSPKEIYPELKPSSRAGGKMSDTIFVTVTLQPNPEWEKIGQLTVR